MPLTDGSSSTSASTAATSGPSSSIGTVTISMPYDAQHREVPVVAGHRADERDRLLVASTAAASRPRRAAGAAGEQRRASSSGSSCRRRRPARRRPRAARRTARAAPAGAGQPAVVADIDAVGVLEVRSPAGRAARRTGRAAPADGLPRVRSSFRPRCLNRRSEAGSGRETRRDSAVGSVRSWATTLKGTPGMPEGAAMSRPHGDHLQVG